MGLSGGGLWKAGEGPDPGEYGGPLPPLALENIELLLDARRPAARPAFRGESGGVEEGKCPPPPATPLA